MTKHQDLLAGKRIVLTGISRGIGRAAAEALLGNKAEVIGVGRNKENLDKAAAGLKEFGEAVSFVLGDIGEPQSAVKVAEEVKKRWGALDLLINNAAIMKWSNSFEEDEEGWLEESLRVNVLSIHYITRNLLPFLRKGKQPRILNYGSGAGQIKGVLDSGEGSMGSYRLSKLAVNGLTMLYANQLKGQVSVLTVDPGWIKTDLGGPEAPEDTSAAVQRLVDSIDLDWEVTGKFVKGKDILDW